MSNMDEGKGRAKETVGKATDDKQLQREGKADRGAGKAKKGIDKLKGRFAGKRAR